MGSGSAPGQHLSLAAWFSGTRARADDSCQAAITMRRIRGVLAICRIRVSVTDLFRVPRNPGHVRTESLADIKMRAQWQH